MHGSLPYDQERSIKGIMCCARTAVTTLDNAKRIYRVKMSTALLSDAIDGKVAAQFSIAELKAEYLDVISRPKLSEEALHQFLVTFPVFLPILWPLQNAVFSKLSLGSQHRTDFAFARENTPGVTWHLSEIEKPQDRLFTKSGNPSAKLPHAIRQLHDWNTWFIENRSYLARHLPFSAEMRRFGLWKPELLLVMGRRSEVSEEDRRLMQRMAENAIQIVTFDRLADRMGPPSTG